MTKSDKVQIGIISAMRIEAEGLVSQMTESTSETVSGIEYRSGILMGKRCVVAVCGVGKVFAAMCAQTMILKYSPDIIINSGVAGTLTSKLGMADIAIAESLVQHDMDTSPVGDPVGLISGINIINIPCDSEASSLLYSCAEGRARAALGVIASGDRFIADSESKERIAGFFGAIACEMEGAAIAQICYVNKVPLCVMRAISDGGDESAGTDYPTFVKTAAERASEITLDFVSKYSRRPA